MKNGLFKILMVIVVALIPLSNAHASGIPVVDIANLAKQIISNINEALMIKNQIEQIANDIKNLTKLDFSILDEYSGEMRSLFEKMGEVHGLMQELANLEDRFEELYPDFNNLIGELDPELASDAVNKALDESRDMMLGASKTGSAVLENLPKTQEKLEELLSDSHSAEGILQAAQAGNQIGATISSNLMSLTAVMTNYVQAYISFAQKENLVHAIQVKRAKDLMTGKVSSTVAPVPMTPF